jgi:hypothetical protein
MEVASLQEKMVSKQFIMSPTEVASLQDKMLADKVTAFRMKIIQIVASRNIYCETLSSVSQRILAS